MIFRLPYRFVPPNANANPANVTTINVLAKYILNELSTFVFLNRACQYASAVMNIFHGKIVPSPSRKKIVYAR